MKLNAKLKKQINSPEEAGDMNLKKILTEIKYGKSVELIGLQPKTLTALRYDWGGGVDVGLINFISSIKFLSTAYIVKKSADEILVGFNPTKNGKGNIVHHWVVPIDFF